MEEEALSFFDINPGSSLNPEQVSRIVDLTRGWAAGLRLMHIGLSKNPDRLEAWRAGRKLAVEYLTEEIINQLAPLWGEFLQKMAVPDSFTVEMAEMLTGNVQAAQMIEEIQLANLFLERRGTYTN